MKKTTLIFLLLSLGFFIGHKYTLDKKKEHNSEILTACLMSISKSNKLKDFLQINTITEDNVFNIKYNNTSQCIDFEKFNITLIKFHENFPDTFKIKISETIKPQEEVVISLSDFKFDKIEILNYEIISLNLSTN